MSAIEIEGTTVDEAIQIACERLQRPADQLNIEIISHGSPGIFGLGTRKAKILVSPKESSDDKALSQAKEILEQIISYVQIPATVEARWEDDCIWLDITSNGSGLLIGKRGQTLHALQYIVNKMFAKQAGSKTRIIIDTENYRQRRRQALTELAMQLAARAKKSGKPASSNPLSAHDRRIIHLALKEDPELRTRSKGEGPLRKVVVYPTRKATGQGASPSPQDD